GRFKRRPRDVTLGSAGTIPRMVWQDRKITHDMWQFPIVLLIETELNFPFADRYRLDDIVEILIVHRVIGLEGFKGPDHILRSDWFAIMETGTRVDPVGSG